MIELTDDQREKLEKLWFVYGNGGKKHTHLNHKYVQGILEQGIDSSEAYSAVTKDGLRNPVTDEQWEKTRLTPECIFEVEKVLNKI